MLPIHIPQTGDAAMQQFFHDIVGQLQTISLRNSLPPSPALSAVSPAGTHISSFLDSGASAISTAPTTPAMGSSGAGGERTVVPAAAGEGDNSRFEDAEDDESDIGTAVSPAMFAGLDFSYGGGSLASEHPHRASTPVSSIGSSHRAASPVLSVGASASNHRRSADAAYNYQRPKISVRASSRSEQQATSPSRPSARQTASYPAYASSPASGADKENVRVNAGLGFSYPRQGEGRAAPPVAPRPGQQRERQTLGLAISGTNSQARASVHRDTFGDYEFVERPSLDEDEAMNMMAPPKIKKKRGESGLPCALTAGALTTKHASNRDGLVRADVACALLFSVRSQRLCRSEAELVRRPFQLEIARAYCLCMRSGTLEGLKTDAIGDACRATRSCRPITLTRPVSSASACSRRWARLSLYRTPTAWPFSSAAYMSAGVR